MVRPVLPHRRPAQPPSAAALAHELHVHQIELEQQNEELRRAQFDLAAARDRFVDLYDFAPVGYLTLDAEGRIVEVNLTGTALLDEERRRLIGRPFERFVAAPDVELWTARQRAALDQHAALRVELQLQLRAGALLHVQVDCLRVAPSAAPPMLRLTLTDITQRKLAERERRIAASVAAARESERRRVAHELHEELGQRLTVLKMDLAGLPARGQAQSQRIAAMLGMLDEALATVRRISSELRPLMLDELGLNAAVDWLARDSGRRLGMAVELRLGEQDPPLGESAAVAVYRLVEEALAHLARHCHATDVGIELHSGAGELVLTVQDKGSGWPLSGGARQGADNADNLREQARLIGGRLQLGQLPGGGQRFTLHLPLPAAGTDRVTPRTPR